MLVYLVKRLLNDPPPCLLCLFASIVEGVHAVLSDVLTCDLSSADILHSDNSSSIARDEKTLS